MIDDINAEPDYGDEPPFACSSVAVLDGEAFACGGTPGHAGKHRYLIDWNRQGDLAKSTPAPETEAPGYRQACAALAIAVDALQHVRLGTDVKLAALARGVLAEIGRLTYDAEFAADAASLDDDPSAADSGTALYLSAIARLSAGLRDVQHACERGDAPHAIAPVAAAALADVDRLQLLQPPPPEALDIAWNALRHIALHGDGKSAAKARETLRAVNEYLEDGTTEDGIDRTPRAGAERDQLRAALTTLTDRAEASHAITGDEADEYRKLTGNGGES